MANNIFPVFDRIYNREDKERFLNQRAKVVWLTGLSCSGKTTLAAALENDLFTKGHFCQVLDGDNIRSGINSDLGFSEAERYENIRRIAEIARLMLDSGIICICSFISPTRKIREMVRQIIGREDLVEVYLSTPLEVCESRDIKGLYKKARAGELKDFTGISSPFEAPVNPHVVVDTSKAGIEECLAMVNEVLAGRIAL